MYALRVVMGGLQEVNWGRRFVFYFVGDSVRRIGVLSLPVPRDVCHGWVFPKVYFKRGGEWTVWRGHVDCREEASFGEGQLRPELYDGVAANPRRWEGTGCGGNYSGFRASRSAKARLSIVPSMRFVAPAPGRSISIAAQCTGAFYSLGIVEWKPC